MILRDSPFLAQHKGEILRLIRNEEKRARGRNPLERIVGIGKGEGGEVVGRTTKEKLAQRIGRDLRKAYGGKIQYLWSEDTKCLRVRRVRE